MRRVSALANLFSRCSLVSLCALTSGSLLQQLELAPSARAAASERTPTVFIAAGWFTYGATEEDLDRARRLCVSERIALALRLRGCASDELFAAELPARRVFLSAYRIDRYEVSQAELARCVDAGACDPSSYVTEQPGLSHSSQPAIGLSWQAAGTLCAFRGGRLPSEAEWERAARGDSARYFPWGFFYNGALANHGRASLSFDPLLATPSAEEDGYAYLADVTAFESAASPHGLVQMAGNVWEWTADSFAPVRAQPLSVDPSVLLDNGLRSVRGGSFRSPAIALRVTHREGRSEARGFVDVGVRCAYDLP
ncbi:MAG: Sulfatase modifying factor 1 precursor [Myxococcaceae bacterium]|nr:Sulfatase modifying factor 1 precursor [Myxococcaceae bacterium]